MKDESNIQEQLYPIYLMLKNHLPDEEVVNEIMINIKESVSKIVEARRADTHSPDYVEKVYGS